jgi:hypothetical protein
VIKGVLYIFYYVIIVSVLCILAIAVFITKIWAASWILSYSEWLGLMCFYDILRTAVRQPGFLCIIRRIEGERVKWMKRGGLCIILAVGIPSCFLRFNRTCRSGC